MSSEIRYRAHPTDKITNLVVTELGAPIQRVECVLLTRLPEHKFFPKVRLSEGLVLAKSGCMYILATVLLITRS